MSPHPEGGWFSESYTAPFEKDGRSLAGSIYFLLDAGEISHFHEIDCDEIWYWHEGCVMRLTVPKFDYSGFRLIGRDELRERWPVLADETGYLAYPHMDEEALTSSGSHLFL